MCQLVKRTRTVVTEIYIYADGMIFIDVLNSCRKFRWSSLPSLGPPLDEVTMPGTNLICRRIDVVIGIVVRKYGVSWTVSCVIGYLLSCQLGRAVYFLATFIVRRTVRDRRRETVTDRQTETDRQTDRQRQTDGQTGRQAGRQAETDREANRDRHVLLRSCVSFPS